MTPSPVIHLNIPSLNLKESAEFYGRVFGWKSTPNTDEYLLFDDGGHGGGFSLKASPAQDGVLLFVQAEDIEATLDMITAAGGRVIATKRQTGGGGYYAVFEDPHGNLMGIATPH
jgi:predicted enzyme related to lactoylglutathione lyase